MKVDRKKQNSPDRKALIDVAVATAASKALQDWLVAEIPRICAVCGLGDEEAEVLTTWARQLIAECGPDGRIVARHKFELKGLLLTQVCHILPLKWTWVRQSVLDAFSNGLLFLAGKAANTQDVGLCIASTNHVVQGWVKEQLLHALINHLSPGEGFGNAGGFGYLDRQLKGHAAGLF